MEPFLLEVEALSRVDDDKVVAWWTKVGGRLENAAATLFLEGVLTGLGKAIDQVVLHNRDYNIDKQIR